MLGKCKAGKPEDQKVMFLIRKAYKIIVLIWALWVDLSKFAKSPDEMDKIWIWVKRWTPTSSTIVPPDGHF